VAGSDTDGVAAFRGQPAVSTPEVTLVVVAYHQRADLARLLPTVADATRQTVEVIVVDNGPGGDDTGSWLAAHYPAVRVLTMRENVGYGAANNLGIMEARGRFVVVLNPDTQLLPASLDQLAAAWQPGTFVNPCLLRPDGRVNALGLVLNPAGIATCAGLDEPPPQDPSAFEVSALSGAAIWGLRADWLAVGGFVPEYFLYGEDVEWSLRARSRGYRLRCAPAARIVHHYRGELTVQKYYYLERNRCITWQVAVAPRTRRRLAMVSWVTSTALCLDAVRRGPRFLWAWVRGRAWIINHRTLIGHLANQFQRERVVPEQQLLADWAAPTAERMFRHSALRQPARWYDQAVRRWAARAWL